MDLLSKKRFYFWGGLVGILFFYCLYTLYFVGRLWPDLSFGARFGGKCLFIAVAYLIGAYSLRKQVPGWAVLIWHIAYGLVLIVLVVLGILYWGSAGSSITIWVVAHNLQEFLLSPVMYIALVLVGKAVESGRMVDRPKKGR